MSCDNQLANEWARSIGKNASYITNKDFPQHGLTAQRYLKLLLNTQQVPFMNMSDLLQ